MKEIERLLERYFEGDTSAAEEKILRDFFASGEVPEHLLIHKPLFAYFEEEIRQTERAERKVGKNRKVFHLISGVAAAVVVLLIIGRLWVFPGTTFCGDSYVVINGRCYTDIHTIRQHALNALQEVSTSPEEYFPGMEKEEIEENIMEQQLRELGSLFMENE